MSARITRTQILPLLAALALSFAVAGCASQKGADQPAPGASAQTTAAKPQSTPPDSTASQQMAAQQAPAQEPASTATEAKPEAAQRMGGGTAPGDQVEIRRAWVQVRNQPSQDAQAIALAFGNDIYPVMEQQGEWVRVRLDKSREGWIPLAAIQEP